MADKKVGGAGYEAMLEAKRGALRRALKTEYLRQMYHPNAGVNVAAAPHIFDAAIYRFNAMTFTTGEYKYLTYRNFVSFAQFAVIPMGLFVYFSVKQRSNFEARCRSGEISYDSEERKAKYYL